MSGLLDLLTQSVVEQTAGEDEVAVMLSGGIDGLSVALAARSAGKSVHAYTYAVEGRPSRDLKHAKAIAAHFRWPLTVVKVPAAAVADDFLRLAVEHRCATKKQFEVTLPLVYLLAAIKERVVLTGFNADDYYGNDREAVFRQWRRVQRGVSPAKRKEAFDAERRKKFDALTADPDCDDTWWYAKRAAEKGGKVLVDPYLDERVRDFFLQFCHEELSCLDKPVIRRELKQELARLPRGSIAVGVRLQIGGGVRELFQTLLADRRINRFEKEYASVSALCQRWGREIDRDPSAFTDEPKALPACQAPSAVILAPPLFAPYSMADVRKASAAAKFTVVATFAGGGGSCLGLRLAGGQVKIASEFVREAARTYRTNFPEVPIDERDIRKIVKSPDEVELILLQVGLKPGEFDILSGSFPCAHFSTAGRGFADQNKVKSYSDTAQAGTGLLVYDFIALAQMARPRVVIAENVPAMAARYGSLFRRALHELRFAENGERLFFANYAVLSAIDFGVAQARERLFIVAVRRDVAGATGITSDEQVLRVFPEPTHLPVCLRSALDGLQQSEADLEPWRRAMMTRSLGRFVRALPREPVGCVRLRHVGFSADTRFTLVRASWESPVPTVTASGARRDAFSGIVHPDEDRLLSIAELKRVTGLPDDFVLTGSIDQAAERIGRMVVPFVIRALAESVYERVLKPYGERR